MSVRGVPAPEFYLPEVYWEDRARRFAGEGEGLAAVCSYGMPEFYNRVIDICQRRAIAPWLKVSPGATVLDVGCGVGRWSHQLAARGARVTGVDLSPTMIAEAKRRAASRGVSERCRFETQDLARLDVGGKFDLVMGVTVLQHILDSDSLRDAFRRMADHLADGGRMVLLEVAPSRLARHCDTSIFRARERGEYLKLFAECGMRVRNMAGVDPTPFRYRLLPYIRRLPRRFSIAATTAVSALSLPIDVCIGRFAVERSWHVVFVLEHEGRGHAY